MFSEFFYWQEMIWISQQTAYSFVFHTYFAFSDCEFFSDLKLEHDLGFPKVVPSVNCTLYIKKAVSLVRHVTRFNQWNNPDKCTFDLAAII